VKRPVREILADSHVAAVAIAVLLLWSLDGAFNAVWPFISDALYFAFTAVAILGIPYFYFPTMTVVNRVMLITTFLQLYAAVMSFFAAWLLSRWVYGVGPLRSLAEQGSKLTRRKHV
jgi:hypothetical protein